MRGATRASSRAPTTSRAPRRSGRGRTAKALLLFAALPEDGERSRSRARHRTSSSARAPRRGAAAHALAPGAPAENLRAGFPTGDETDLVEMLFALASVRPRSRRRANGSLARALALLVSRADHRARWKLERPRPDRLPVALERTGEMSRWVTLRALAVSSASAASRCRARLPGGGAMRRAPPSLLGVLLALVRMRGRSPRGAPA